MSDTVPELVRVFASTTSLLNEAALLLELPSRRLVQVNRVFFETLAYAPHEVIGCTPQQGGWWPDVAVMEQFITDAAAGGVAEHVIAVRTREGSSLRSSARPLGSAAQVQWQAFPAGPRGSSFLVTEVCRRKHGCLLPVGSI